MAQVQHVDDVIYVMHKGTRALMLVGVLGLPSFGRLPLQLLFCSALLEVHQDHHLHHHQQLQQQYRSLQLLETFCPWRINHIGSRGKTAAAAATL
jgi:hypothetical protein